MRVSENSVEEEKCRSWRKLQKDEPHSLYSSPNIVRVINQGG
jgi:hypothetical protein